MYCFNGTTILYANLLLDKHVCNGEVEKKGFVKTGDYIEVRVPQHFTYTQVV